MIYINLIQKICASKLKNILFDSIELAKDSEIRIFSFCYRIDKRFLSKETNLKQSRQKAVKLSSISYVTRFIAFLKDINIIFGERQIRYCL